MSDKKNTELDQLYASRFRNDASTSYKEVYWEGFKEQLDEVLPEKRKKRRGIWFFWTSLVMVSAYGVWFLTMNETTENIKKENPISQVPHKSTTNSTKSDQTEPASSTLSNVTIKKSPTAATLADSAILPLQTKSKETPASSHQEKLDQTGVASSILNYLPPKEAQTATYPEITLPAQHLSVTLKPDTISEAGQMDTAYLSTFTPPPPLILRDTQSQQVNLPTSDFASSPKEKTSQKTEYAIQKRVDVLAGINYGEGLSNTKSVDKPVIDAIFGLSYMHPFKPHWAVYSEVHYLPKSGHHLKQSNEIVTYFLDRNVEKNEVETRLIHYIQLPVALAWQFRPNHQFRFGLFASTVLNTRSKSNQISTINGTTQQKNTGNRVKGYYAGLTQFNYGLQTAYSFRLSTQFSLELRYLHGLSDQTKTEYYGDFKHTFSDVQFGIKYNLFTY